MVDTAATRTAAAPPGVLQGARILVADDQADVLQALRLLLKGEGAAIETATSPAAVLAAVEARDFDIALIDLNYTRDTTSGREGLDLLERVKRCDPALPVVVMTGWGSIDTAVEAMRRGAKSFVEKPWEELTLVEIARREVADGLASRRRDASVARENDEAQLIQRALLPSTMPTLDGFDIAALWTPALGIGGDCYDVLRFSDSRVAVSIADVVGKGLPAALLMSNLQAAVRAFATAHAEPHEVCGSVNRLLCRNIAAGKFVTFCYVVADAATDMLAFGNAGHNPPVVYRANGDIDVLPPTGLVLGVSADWIYTTGTAPLAAGDRLVCFTDGITEARSPDDEEFGDERLIATIAAEPPGSAERLAHAISRAVVAWTNDRPQDDATLIVVDRKRA
jgi:phosphoserine phosphatase RsbU/P